MNSKKIKSYALVAIVLSLVLTQSAKVKLAAGTFAPGISCVTNPVVANNNDTGAGSLRQAILDACAGSTITFAGSIVGPITLESELTIDKSLTIQGPGASALTISGNNTARVFSILDGNYNVTFLGLTIADGNVGSSNFGGAIKNGSAGTITITNCVLSGNSGISGGAILNTSTGTLILANSAMSNNTATFGSGGGAIATSLTAVTITNCSFFGNTSEDGGAILSFGNAPITITNSTFADNHADANFGGAIYSINAPLVITNSTFANNSARGGGAIDSIAMVAMTLKNTIIANNTASSFGPDVAGSVNSLDYNLIENTSGATIFGATTHNIYNQDPKLGPLQDNGGPTKTMALLTGSPAIDQGAAAIDPATGNPIITDQRGSIRPFDLPIPNADGGDGSDIGAFEVQCLSCPADVIQQADPNECGAVVNYPEPTTIEGCGAIICTPASGSFFPVGTTTVNCSVTNGAKCSFTVTVNDNQPPTIMCSDNITTSADAGQCSALLKYQPPFVTDNCPCSSTAKQIKAPSGDTSCPATCNPASGSDFPTGTTTVTCTATDASGNTATCTFTVTVTELQPPTITCPANQVRCNDPNQCGAVVSYPAPTASDNCPGVSASCSPASGSFFPKGTTTVTCTATDTSGNTATCTFSVTVNDCQPPTITCPASVTSVTPVIGGTGAVVTFPPPTANDNCPGVTTACNPPSGSTFPVGCTTVTCTAMDTSGNTATCTFPVCVFNICLQDDSNANNRILINTTTGDYRFCCNGTTYTGKGKMTIQGNTFTLEHNAIDRRVRASATGSAHAGNASLQSPPGRTRCVITDSDTTNNTNCNTCQ